VGLYLCLFEGDDDDEVEIEGVDVGHYSDFAVFRDAIRDRLEGGDNGSRFPILMNHSDCDGEWTPREAKQLDVELTTIQKEFAEQPPIALSGWQLAHVKSEGLTPKTLLECFFDVDGEPLLERLRGLCASSVERGLPIRFQ
jgi:hypothetical protein